MAITSALLLLELVKTNNTLAMTTAKKNKPQQTITLVCLLQYKHNWQ